jgi:hypothetical protein
MSKDAEPRELQIVSGGTLSKEPERPLARLPFSRFLFRARHETAVTNANADHVEAQTRLGQAIEGLERTAGRLGDLGTILAGDKAERDTTRLALENLRAREERTARTRELQDQIQQEEPPPPKRSVARSLIDERLGELRTVAELRAEGERMVEELLGKGGGEVPPDLAREAENIRDAVQELIHLL